jgi:hypothetical protein
VEEVAGVEDRAWCGDAGGPGPAGEDALDGLYCEWGADGVDVLTGGGCAAFRAVGADEDVHDEGLRGAAAFVGRGRWWGVRG